MALWSQSITNDSMHLDQNADKLMILKSDSVLGIGVFFRAIPCSMAHFEGHLFVFIIDLKIIPTGAASSTGNSLISFFGRSPGTPFDLGFFAIPGCCPGGDFGFQGCLVRDAPVEALPRQNAEFAFSDVQPGAVFWRVMPFEPVGDTAGLGGREGLI